MMNVTSISCFNFLDQSVISYNFGKRNKKTNSPLTMIIIIHLIMT